MIAIIDYGRGNLGSVEKAFARVAVPAAVTQDPRVVDDARFYFVHSYYPEARTTDCATTGAGPLKQAWCEYGVRFAAAVELGAIHATQFHPEKSQRWGLRMLENFAAIVKDSA